MKSKQFPLPFSESNEACQLANDEPILRVSEIEISYHPVVKPSDRISGSCSRVAERIFRRMWHQLELWESFYVLFFNRGKTSEIRNRKCCHGCQVLRLSVQIRNRKGSFIVIQSSFCSHSEIILKSQITNQ